MSYNSISGEIPSGIGQLRELRVLGLAGNKLSGVILSSLGDLQSLIEIDLSNNELIGNIPISLGNFHNLVFMDLPHNKLNGSIPRKVFNLPTLSSYLNLSQNQLSGPLPEEIGLLENVVIINISDNRLSYEIPNSMGECGILEQLLLARNMISGRIPDAFNSIRGLKILGLSSNKLYGEIPSGLPNMQSLQFLNLSFNNLQGRVPSGGIFKNSSKFHLENNQDLCLDSLCGGPHVRRRRLDLTYIRATVSIVAALCFAIVLMYNLRKGKRRMKVSFKSYKGLHPMISCKEIRHATDNFHEQNLIGKGSFGKVYKGILQGAEVAINVLDAAVARSKKSFLAECASLKYVRHQNLVKLINVCSSINSKNEEFIALIFEFMSNGSLGDWLKGDRRINASKTGLNLSQRLSYAIGFASALDNLHNETEDPICLL